MLSMRDKVNIPNADSLSNEALDYMNVIMRSKNDPVYFVDKVLGQKMFPKQAEITREFYKHKYNNMNRPQYKRLILALGQRSGKTALGAMLGTYEMFDICLLENPSEHYGLIKNQPIFIPVVAPSEEQVLDGVFYNIANYVENSEWLMSWTDWQVRRDEIFSPSKNVSIKPFSSWATTGRGRTSKCVIFDELDMFEDTTSKRGGSEVYTALDRSTATLGMDGHTIALSSTKSPTGMILTLYNKARIENDKTTLAYRIPTWEANPHFTKESLMEEFKYDMATFWKDFGCMPQMWSGLQFPDGVQLKPIRNVLMEPITVPAVRRPRIMAIDPAVKNDSFGVAVGYKQDDRFVVDGAIKFTRKDGDIIIKPSFIKAYLKRVIPPLQVYMLVTDTWMYPDIIEDVTNMGLFVQQHIVKKNEYDLVKSLMSAGRLDIVEDTSLKLELEQLVIKGGMHPNVDHPLNGSKDCADCVANVVWHLNETNVNANDCNLLLARTF